MAPGTDDRSNLGQTKPVKFHLKAAGLTEDHFLGKYLLWNRYVLDALVFIFVCLEVCGVAIRLLNGNFTAAQIVIPFQFVFIIGCIPVETYILIYRTNVASECVKNSTELLHSLSYVGETKIRQKHSPLFKFFMWTFVWNLYVAALILTVISPLVRFGFKTGDVSYICCPVWYPVDVFSSSWLFWTAYLYEAIMFWFFVHAYSNVNITFLQVFTLARVRLDALNRYFQELTSKSEQLRQKPWGRELESSGLTKAGVNISQNNSTSSRDHMVAEASDKLSHDATLQRLKKGVEDLYKLQRQAHLIGNTFKVFFTSVHLVGFLTISVMWFASANGLRNPNRTLRDSIAESFVFFFVAMAGASQPLTVSCNTDLLQDAYDKLRFSLYESHWYTETTEFKKLFILVQSVLNRPLTMKAYSFYPLNLCTFNSSLKGSFSYFLFLYQLTAPKK